MDETSDDCEDSPHRENVVEMSYNIVGVVKYNV